MGRSILIAVDGSAESKEAIQIGLELAADRGAAVTFLHIDPAVAEALDELDRVRGPSQEQILNIDSVLAEAAGQARAKGVAARVEVAGSSRDRPSMSEIADAIVGIAEGLEVELIVLGSRGHGPLENALLGSVSAGVLQRSTIPVVVVRPARSSER